MDTCNILDYRRSAFKNCSVIIDRSCEVECINIENKIQLFIDIVVVSFVNCNLINCLSQSDTI